MHLVFTARRNSAGNAVGLSFLHKRHGKGCTELPLEYQRITHHYYCLTLIEASEMYVKRYKILHLN